MNTFNKYKKSQNKWLYLVLLVFVVVNIIGFIFSTFYDQMISDYLTLGMNVMVIKIWADFSSQVGWLLPIWSSFIALTVFLESFAMHAKQKQFSQGFLGFFSKTSDWLMWIYYIGMFVGGGTYCLCVAQTYPNSDTFMIGAGRNAKTLDSNTIAVACSAIVTACTMALVLVTSLVFRFKIKNDPRFLSNRFWVPAVKMAIMVFVSYMTVLLLKSYFGRPYYFVTILTKEPTYGPGKSIVEIMRDLGWSDVATQIENGDNPLWHQVDYYPWYISNHGWDNISHWFTVAHVDFHGDEWWNQDFPSGHVNGTITAASLCSFFYYDKRTQKNNWCQNTGLGIACFSVVSMQLAMIVYRFHWSTDVTFSGFIGILWWWFIDWVIDKKWVKHLYTYRGNKMQKNKATVTWNEDKTKVLLYCYVDEKRKLVEAKKVSKKKPVSKIIACWKKGYHIKILENDIEKEE